MHKTYTDEDSDYDGGIMWKAFCETCDWSADNWEHADRYQDEDDPADAAWSVATLVGLDHEKHPW